jgi:hypothetical protein
VRSTQFRLCFALHGKPNCQVVKEKDDDKNWIQYLDSIARIRHSIDSV